MNWQPIATAPRDTKSRLVWCPDNRCTFNVSWLEDPPCSGWIIFGGNGAYLREEPTHWMPVPDPPTTAAVQPTPTVPPVRSNTQPGPLNPPVPPKDRYVVSFPLIHCECGTAWTQEVNTVCPNCSRWPKRSADVQPTPEDKPAWEWRCNCPELGPSQSTTDRARCEVTARLYSTALEFSDDGGATWQDAPTQE